MQTEKFNKWVELLLDTGKRNNLVNFRDSKLASVEVVSPDYGDIYKYAEKSATLEVYDPKLNESDDNAAGAFDAADESEEEKVRRKQTYIKTYSKKLKKHQILIYNRSNKPLSALKNIARKAQTAVEETGVNIAYIAFGFVNWCEADNSQIVMRAPLLLAPVTIQNESAIDPFVIKISLDEIIVNPTFSFKLFNDYGIKLPEFDDDYGLDKYFEAVEHKISKLKWKVSTECKIGMFSFLKINMYNDLKENADIIVRNKCVRALLGDAEDLNSNINAGTGYNAAASDYADLRNVVDADSSQADAIEMAKRGVSFVLQGPPGTGKSQTITNIIAECISDGKKVLFVSEKLAALNVVYEKLKQAGLEEFCLELHSHKANKKQVIEELCHTLKLPRSGVSEKATKELRAKQEAQQKLDGYVAELHKRREKINKSLYDIFEEISACRHAPDIEYAVENIGEKGEAFIDKVDKILAKYVGYAKTIGYDYHNNEWYGYLNPDISYEAKIKLKHDLSDVLELCRGVRAIAKSVSDCYGITVDSLTASCALWWFFELCNKSDYITPSLLDADVNAATLAVLEEMKGLAAEIHKQKRILDKYFDEEIYKIDGKRIYKKLVNRYHNVFKRIFSSDYKRTAASICECLKYGAKLKYTALLRYMRALDVFQQKVAEFRDLEKSIKGNIGRAYKGIDTNFVQCEADIKEIADLCSMGISFGGLSQISYAEFSEQQEAFMEFVKQYKNVYHDYEEAERRLVEKFDVERCDLRRMPLRKLERRLEECLENLDILENWGEFLKVLDGLRKLELMPFIDTVIYNQVPLDKIAATYKKIFYRQWTDVILNGSEILSELARVPHDEAVRIFREKDALNLQINKAKIKAVLSATRPDTEMVAQGSSVSVLLREGEKKRKQKSLRALFSEVGELAQVLKPCFLMSPLSVSAFLSPETSFDVVVFDEASQIFPQDAIGAIYRGKQLIVVGDSKQMPPSNFFAATVDAETDDEIEEITDFESILDLCSVTFPQRRLKWHYRSRYESLISFSNKNFYDNELISFPSVSPDRDREDVGVEYVFVDGTFDRTSKTNRIEAEKIVDMVFEHFEKFPERSLGVVAFSISQQTLIENLIARRRLGDQSKETFFRSDRREPFFVKNIETVQGDERDTVIFSVAYGRDKAGKLLLNFGPVNREGGERRLNVAVTRAKYNVKLVSSMHAVDIDLKRTQSVGAKLLREYLDYAENGTLALERKPKVNKFEEYDSEFEKEVSEFLQSNGYYVDSQVGYCSYKIDLAVKRPNSSDYVLAVECDGATYHSSRNARDRDRLRQDILESMGWSFYRIWSTDWFRNKETEKERLINAVKQALAKPKKRVARAGGAVNSFEEKVEIKSFAFPVYEMADEVKVAKDLNYNVPLIVRTILEIEAPLSEEWLLKRICYIFGRNKVTSIVEREYEEQMWNCKAYGIERRRDGFLYLAGRPVPVTRVPAEDEDEPREIGYIAIEELANGFRELLKHNVTAEKNGLFKLLANRLGYQRLGDNIIERFEKALDFIYKEIDEDGDILSLKNNK